MLLRNITHPGSQTVTDDGAKRGWVTGVQNRYANLVWDVYGRLEGMGDLARNGSGVQTDSYRYYPDGLRYRKDETSATGVVTTTLYLYEGNDILLKEKLEGSTWKTAQVSVRLGGMEVGRYVKDYIGTTERLEYVWQDNLGSRRAVTDTTGAVKAKIDYGVWGGSTVTNFNGYDGSQDVSYTGKERDATGLYYFNARYYDTVAGRFYSEDPVRDVGNWFVYCGNNPLSSTDPTGLADVGASNPVLSMLQYIVWRGVMEDHQWSSLDMYDHYRNGGGNLSLADIGWDRAVIDVFTQPGFPDGKSPKSIADRFGEQIGLAAKSVATGKTAGKYAFAQNFRRTYDFEGICFAFGGATLGGEFNGVVSVGEDGSYQYSGTATITFTDTFTDPYDTGNRFPGEWNPDGSPYVISGSWGHQYSGAQ